MPSLAKNFSQLSKARGGAEIYLCPEALATLRGVSPVCPHLMAALQGLRKDRKGGLQNANFLSSYPSLEDSEWLELG